MTPPASLTVPSAAREEARALVVRALHKDPEAVGVLVERLMPIVRARAFRALRRHRGAFDTALLDDRVQELWMSLFAQGGARLLAYDPSRGASLEHFVGVLAEREVALSERAERAQKRGGRLQAVDLSAADELPTHDADPAQEAEAQQLALRLGEHLDAQLPETGRLVFRYAFRDSVEPPAVARIMGVDVQVVYNWQHKIRRLARAFLDELAST